ncbi:putative aliphatic sulfonates transport permease protein SsuC [Oxobacter pfennigii]|uniref:Putative aliphatic sulfonates transport permease protein SsuC n=1 Tax=Oxobacter pfennigii TaxID=36849 RepID=A0A0P8X378_9CLOT|nr:ABC transporter permease [Oxobacter pfennigii]KPU45225.1 putative aliphatic sulfonates transport permease protein SsuC [Oxobacter pfennigii]
MDKKEKYKVNLVWTACIFLFWEFGAFILDKVLNDPLAEAKLPYPHSIILSITQNFTDLMTASGLTFSRAVMGFTIGALVGFGLAIIMSLSKVAEKIALPYLIVSQMIPVLGLAPIIFTLVKDMDASRIVIAAYITFFPVAINMLSGLNSVDMDKKELLYSYAAKKRSIYYKLMVPFSLPYLFAGLKIAAPMSITASILVDMLGSKGGIGVKLLYSLYSGTKDVFWASVVTSALMGIISYFIVVLFEKIAIPWRRQEAN